MALTVKMNSGNVVIDSGKAYPILYIPKNCTTLLTNCELMDNAYMDVSITSTDPEGNVTCIYKGLCLLKLVNSHGVNSNQGSPDSTGDTDIAQMPVILSEPNPVPYKSQVWIDPSRSPYVYYHYDPVMQEQNPIRESGGLIMVAEHNTYVTQNIYNCNESNVSNYEEAPQSPVKDFECEGMGKGQELVASHSDTNTGYYEEDEFESGVFLSELPGDIMD